MSTTCQKSMKSKLALIFTGVTLAVACLNPLGKEALAGKFSRSCEDFALTGDSILSATCKDRNANKRRTSLNLNRRIRNKNGYLTTGGGNYVSTCKNIGWGRGVSLKADCRTYNGDWRYSTLNLDSIITNNDGNLTFDR
ncbi:MAG: CVNH domain-containing protein [Rivularia sp. T60_A2020_040]|nr:CVNH domain-containing protein [Rivularia sp. T60_A2020_040]